MKKLIIAFIVVFITPTFLNAETYNIADKKGCANGNCSDGQGTYISPKDRKYEGEWKNGLPHGQGTATASDGSKMVGNWKDGKAHGQMTFTSSLLGFRIIRIKDEFKNGEIVKRKPTKLEAMFASISSFLGGVKDEEEYTLSILAKPASEYSVEFTVKTNVPLPVKVMAGMDLKNQKPDDVYIGYSKKIKLVSPKQTFIIDASSKKLPSGDYVAKVTFYPRWGAKNGNPKASNIKQQISDSVELRLKGSGESSSDVDQRHKSQRWVMENVIIGTIWNKQIFVKRLGAYERIKADMNLHKAYYFPKADMTIIVNSYKGTVSIWRMGRASK